MDDDPLAGINRGQRYRLENGVKIWRYDIYGFGRHGDWVDIEDHEDGTVTFFDTRTGEHRKATPIPRDSE